MRLFAWLSLVVALGLSSRAGHAGESAQAQPEQAQQKKEKARPERIHLGAPSVTVVDEHEAVDDVITRIRQNEAAGRGKTAAKPEQVSQPQPQPQPTADRSQKDGRAALRAQREHAAAGTDAERRKDERRERAATTRGHLEQKQRR